MTEPVTTGEQARQLISRQLSRLVDLEPAVLLGEDHEALHQYRVSLRRLRSLLRQFGPALELPRRLSRARIAALARATGSCRDADVLREHLEQRLLPRLDPGERQGCTSLLRRLKRQRRQAMAELQTELSSQRTHKLLHRMEQWCQQPRFSSLGELSLAEWLPEWLQASSGGCFLHAGWFATQPNDGALHDLRKHIKEVRYGLEALRGWLGDAGEAWISDLRSVQSCLGDLHDQQVLVELMREHEQAPPALSRALERDSQEVWTQWQQLRDELLQPERRQTLLRLWLRHTP